MQLQYSLLIVIVLAGHTCAGVTNHPKSLSPVDRPTTIRPSTSTKQTYRISDPVFTCSNWLSNMITNLCNNAYNIVKREVSPFMDKLVPDSIHNHMKKQVFESESWRRVRRQVASECCLKACRVADIITYCPLNAKILIENPEVIDLLDY